MLSEERLVEVARRLTGVPGIVGVMLGGSRARGAEHPDSDVDLGLYYRRPLDVAALRDLAAELAAARPGAGGLEVNEPGAWGRWVDGVADGHREVVVDASQRRADQSCDLRGVFPNEDTLPASALAFLNDVHTWPYNPQIHTTT